MNIENNIKGILAEKMQDGTIEKIVKEEFEKSIQKAVGDLFGSYGAVTREIENNVKSVILPYLETYDYSNYIVKLDTVLSEILNNTTLDNRKILENFKYLMSTEKIKEISITEMLHKYGDMVSEDIDTLDLEIDYDDTPTYQDVEVTVTVEFEEKRSWSSYEYANVLFECAEDESLNRELRLYKFADRWDIYSMSITDISSLRNINIFDLFLITLKQDYAEIKFDVEEESIDVEIKEEPEASFY